MQFASNPSVPASEAMTLTLLKVLSAWYFQVLLSQSLGLGSCLTSSCRSWRVALRISTHHSAMLARKRAARSRFHAIPFQGHPGAQQQAIGHLAPVTVPAPSARSPRCAPSCASKWRCWTAPSPPCAASLTRRARESARRWRSATRCGGSSTRAGRYIIYVFVFILYSLPANSPRAHPRTSAGMYTEPETAEVVRHRQFPEHPDGAATAARPPPARRGRIRVACH